MSCREVWLGTSVQRHVPTEWLSRRLAVSVAGRDSPPDLAPKGPFTESLLQGGPHQGYLQEKSKWEQRWVSQFRNPSRCRLGCTAAFTHLRGSVQYRVQGSPNSHELSDALCLSSGSLCPSFAPHTAQGARWHTTMPAQMWLRSLQGWSWDCRELLAPALLLGSCCKVGLVNKMQIQVFQALKRGTQ